MNKPSNAKCRTPSHVFVKHFIRNLTLGFSILLVILLIGMCGYHHFERADWLESYANAAMIVSGVGTLTNPQTPSGKFFIATYALFGGVSFLLVAAVVFAPIFH